MVSGFQAFVDMIFNPVFGWLLDVPSLLAIVFLASLLALISTLLQKYLTDQAKMKRLRDDTKKYQEQMKRLREDPEKLLKVQQKVMPIQMELMKESFKPLLVTLVPFLLVFFWLSSHFAYFPIEPNTPFTVSATFEEGVGGVAVLGGASVLTIDSPERNVKDGAASWVVKGPAGEHYLNLTFAGATFERKVLITDERAYLQPQMPLSGTVKSFDVGNKKLTPLGDGFSLFGWHPGWIFYYILLSIPLSLLLKKLLKVV
ncbi:TPA: DUF106 domain-containing protein [Candidatus Woesearchaeota archaeon]|nr:DUF106 domain-containing protein [Candidatus Woesearchaeota archaeon]